MTLKRNVVGFSIKSVYIIIMREGKCAFPLQKNVYLNEIHLDVRALCAVSAMEYFELQNFLPLIQYNRIYTVLA
jgi:hypothetical protein